MGKRKGFSSDDMLELFLWIIPIAVIMARVIYVLANNSQHHYFPLRTWDDFVNSIAIWDGGITIYGGMLGGIMGGFFWCLKKKVKLSAVLDMCVPVLLLCQSLGRWGNFCNQEAFGQLITNPSWQFFPFGVYITRSMLVADGWYQATFFYESILNFLASIAFYIFWRKNKFDGILVPSYLVWYCIVRLCLDFLREDGLVVTKVACAIIIPIGTLIAVLLYYYGVEKTYTRSGQGRGCGNACRRRLIDKEK
jgi:prolipoprotein diacylglyceryl transferase